MKTSHQPAVRIVVVGGALTAYVLLAHYASSLPPEEGLESAAIALLPYLVAALALAWRSRHRYVWLALIAGLAFFTGLLLATIGDHAVWVYFLQHAGGNAVMALVFGSTLGANRVPLCARIAATVHGPLEPRLARYTRQVTLAWTVFFAGMAGLSVLLFAYATVHLWSVFANLLAIPLVALMFAVEYGVRLWRLPDIEHVSFLEGIRLCFRAARASTPPSA